MAAKGILNLYNQRTLKARGVLPVLRMVRVRATSTVNGPKTPSVNICEPLCVGLMWQPYVDAKWSTYAETTARGARCRPSWWASSADAGLQIFCGPDAGSGGVYYALKRRRFATKRDAGDAMLNSQSAGCTATLLSGVTPWFRRYLARVGSWLELPRRRARGERTAGGKTGQGRSCLLGNTIFRRGSGAIRRIKCYFQLGRARVGHKLKVGVCRDGFMRGLFGTGRLIPGL